ncbi:hypothetical protein JCM10213_004863 [Rhodosporidiobolus nylandii]
MTQTLALLARSTTTTLRLSRAAAPVLSRLPGRPTGFFAPSLRPSSSAPMSNSSLGSSVPPLGSSVEPADYASGREKALQYAKEQGFPQNALVEVATAWGEQDSNAHVNNAVYFRWLESGRLAYMRELTRALPEDIARDLRGSGKGRGVILAKITFDYRLPTFHPDSILVMHRPRQCSKRKMIIDAVVYSYSQKAVVGTSEAVMVSYDYTAGKTVDFPQEVLDELQRAGAEKVESAKAKL